MKRIVVNSPRANELKRKITVCVEQHPGHCSCQVVQESLNGFTLLVPVHMEQAIKSILREDMVCGLVPRGPGGSQPGSQTGS